MTTVVKLVDEQGVGCGHVVEVTHVSADRRVECHCGEVYVVRVRPPREVEYTVRRLPREEGGELWPSPSL